MKSMLSSTAEQSHASDTLTVLIVEDEDGVANYLKELLAGRSDPSFACSVARDLARGLEFLAKSVFDVVLLDLGLPDSQGLGTVVSVREKFPGIPIIVLTGLTDETAAMQALRMDIQDYLIKAEISGPLLARAVRYAIERKRSLDALRANEAKYHGLFETMTEAFARCQIILDDEGRPVDFRFLDVNKAWELFTGISAEVALGKTARELVPEVEQGLIEVCAAVALTGKKTFFDQYNKRLDMWFEVYLYCPEKGYFASFSRDVTAHKRAIEALQESEERMQLASQAANLGTYDIDLVSRRVFWSPELKSLFGLPGHGGETVPLEEGLRFVHPEDLPRVKKALSASMDPVSGGKFVEEHRIARTDGSILWVNMRGETFFEGEGEARRAVRTTGVLLDITKRKQAEAAFRESEERYRALVHAGSNAVWRMSADGDTLLELTGNVARQFTQPEKRSGEWINLIHPDDRKRTLEAWRRAVESKSLYENESRTVHADGTYHYFLSRGVPVLNASGKVREWIGSSLDVTERKRAEEALRESEERFHTLADNIAQLAWMADETGWVFWFNKRWFDYTGTNLEEMRGWGWTKVHYPEHVGRIEEKFLKSFEKGEAWEDTFLLRSREGNYRWFLCRVIPIRDEQGKVVRWFGTKTDITDRKRMEEEIRHIAQHDPLTGLPNRRLFSEIITVELAQSRRSGRRVAIFFLDLDRFKEINDTLGHETGDELLKQTALRLRSVIRTSDTVARIGGDEFNVVISEITYPEYASEVAQKILNEIRKPLDIKGKELVVSTSIGISVYPDDSEEIDTLLRYADIAMYYAKEHGRNMYQFYNPVINTRSLERMRLETGLREAIERDQFRLYLQPLVDVQSLRIVSAEVLLRWQHPDRGLLEPGGFFPSAEEIGFMPEIDAWVFTTAGNTIKSWMDQGVKPVCIAVNLSSAQFENPDMTERIARMLRETGIPPQCLEIEIKESTAMADVESAMRRLGELRNMGIRISIDNFGMGCSSLNHLKKLPVHKLKMDRSFVRDLVNNPGDRAIITAVLLMAHTMKLKVAASGVESCDQLAFLKKARCDEAQGYLLGRPVPAEEFRDMLTAGK
jgi:diguanylate cyclase (GGDEF)-like protein/PAS domain S-box-containing protein